MSRLVTKWNQTKRNENLSSTENFVTQKTQSGTNTLQTTRVSNNCDVFYQVRDFVTSKRAARAHKTATEVTLFMQEKRIISI